MRRREFIVVLGGAIAGSSSLGCRSTADYRFSVEPV
jgi:hypothetical protein